MNHPKDGFVTNKVSVSAVAKIGIHETSGPGTLYVDRKAQAPKCNCTTHSSGSQGKH